MKTVELATLNHVPSWKRFRDHLFGEIDPEISDFDIDRFLNSSDQDCFIALSSGHPVGFGEIVLRNLVDGCRSSPVAYLEAIYVDPEYRNQGFGRLLFSTAEDWARKKGCSEFATDTGLDDSQSQRFHQHMGFRETYRIIQYRKPIAART